MKLQSARSREPQSVLNRLIQEWMAANHLSQARAAAQLRVPPSWLRKLFAHKIVRLRPSTIERLARGLALPEPVIRLAVAIQIAEDAAKKLDEATSAAGAYLTSGQAHSKSTARHAARLSWRLKSTRWLWPTMATPDATAEWDRLRARLSAGQKSALVALLAAPGR